MNRQLSLVFTITVATGIYVMTPSRLCAKPQELQPANKPTVTKVAQAEQPARYLITVSEYRLKEAVASQITAEMIADAINAKKAELVESVMLSAIAESESMVQFGRIVSVTVGRVVQGQVNVRNVKSSEIGTILRVTVSPKGNKVAAQLSFESSRLVGEGTEDSPPDTVSTTITTTQLFDLAKPTLVSASTSGEGSFIFFTVSSL